MSDYSKHKDRADCMLCGRGYRTELCRIENKKRGLPYCWQPKKKRKVK